MRTTTRETLVLAGWIAAAALARWIPHPANFTPVAAIALFGGAHFRSAGSAVAVTLGAMLAGDLLLGFHDQMAWVYGSLAATVWIGRWVRDRKRLGTILAGSLASSVLFFVVTNFGVWAAGTLYPRTGTGLLECYVAALPFFGRTVAGDLFFAGILFGSYAWFGARFVTTCSGASATR